MADDDAIGTKAHFYDARDAYDYLEGRGYRLTRNNNWLPPQNLDRISEKDVVAALFLGHTDDYGGIINLKPCPFCGGKADPFSPIGVECPDCGGNAPDPETWQRRQA